VAINRSSLESSGWAAARASSTGDRLSVGDELSDDRRQATCRLVRSLSQLHADGFKQSGDVRAVSFGEGVPTVTRFSRDVPV
jgi:hypothetical protein